MLLDYGGQFGSGGMFFRNQDASYRIDVMINLSGNVGIGTTQPLADSALTVKGKITAGEIQVQSGIADYVFYPNYRLRPLRETAAFIQRNGHLPDIPSEAEVRAKGGFEVGQMQVKLLTKIEELTLHLINAEEKNNRLEQQNHDFRERLKRVEAALRNGQISRNPPR
jgi:hypothetical protein